MEYNSKKEELIIPEYGRHVQGLIRHARTIPDRTERQHFVETVMGLMMQMHPQNRNLEDYKDKLWHHVFQIAEYNLDVTVPGGYVPKPGDERKRPERVPYPNKDTRHKHYGNNVHKLIAKAIEMEDGRKKDGFVQTIGSYMKLAYKTWNREHYVSDDIIIEDLETISGGKLRVVEDAFLDNLTRSNERRTRPQQYGDRDRRGGDPDRGRGRQGGSNGKGSKGGGAGPKRGGTGGGGRPQSRRRG